MVSAPAVMLVALLGAEAPAPNPLPLDPPPIAPRAPDEDAPHGAGGEDGAAPPSTPTTPTPSTPSQPAPDKAPPKPQKPPKPEISTGGIGRGPCWGSAIACGAAGCPLGAGTAFGAGVFVTSINAALAQGGGVLGACFTAVGAGGIIVGVPSAIALGPCASGGALAGGVTGALLDDRDLTPVFLGALPGVVTGLAASGTAVWGLSVLSASAGDYETPALILGTSAALAFAAGPLTIAGISVADGVAGAHPRRGKSIVPDFGRKDDDGTTEARAVGSPRAMAF